LREEAGRGGEREAQRRGIQEGHPDHRETGLQGGVAGGNPADRRHVIHHVEVVQVSVEQGARHGDSARQLQVTGFIEPETGIGAYVD